MIRAWAPGRVNLIGDHTDHTGGLVLPMAIDMGTTVSGRRGGHRVELRSTQEPDPAIVPLDVEDPASISPAWARYVAGVVAEVRPVEGFVGEVTSDLPAGAGLSSSAALEIAVALALDVAGPPVALARLCQRAEHRASGVPCGIMDQLASAAGVAGHALRIDCTTLDVEPIAIPPDIEVVVVDSGERRSLTTSGYGERAAACQEAARLVGPLRAARPDDIAGIEDAVVRRRARHVVSENARVDELVAALGTGDRTAMAAALAASHASLRDDFEVSTPVLDRLVAEVASINGVIGCRLTGAGFGGCVVALVQRGTPVPNHLTAWRVEAVDGARGEP